MQQFTQKLKTGKMQILEVPLPSLQQGQLLIKNHFSLISAGTEASTVKAARKGYIGKAKERPQQVKQVIDVIKSQGLVQAYRAVMKKLDAYSPLGYSCVGEIIDISADVGNFKIGDFVACGGFSASHSEVVCVPENLCVKLDPNTDLKQATYNTLGSIALQGVRQADPRLGESCAIIGLGLLGQLTALMLQAAGVRVIGIDIDTDMVDIAGKHCLDLALQREEAGLENMILEFTSGLGCDAVIIAAASSSLDPINLAGAIARKRGTIVVVGAVPTGFDREPHYYQKELQIKMSCSYGPGRYDPSYEDKGIDYPPAYVRWTENRNMQAFQELIANNKIDVSYLTSHVFGLDEAANAYDLIMSKSEPFIGILIEYDAVKEHDLQNTKVLLKREASQISPAAVSIGFIGAGSYAQSHLLPNIPSKDNVSLKGVMTVTSTSSRSVADRYGFEFCTGKEEDILDDDNINTVFIASRHDSHGKYVIKSLQAQKHVFVEKPLCLSFQELEEITTLATQSQRKNEQPKLLVGYNRRFSPLAREVKEKFGEGTMSMVYRVNAGFIPADSWIQDSETGGGRIIGEVCHFIDFLTYINGSLPVSVFASVMEESHGANDSLNVSLIYENGSIGSISYFANGDKSMPKERIEIFSRGSSAVIEDFKTLSIYNRGRKKDKKMLSQDKGQKAEVKEFIEAILQGREDVIPLHEILNTSLVTFKIIESIRSGQCVKI